MATITNQAALSYNGVTTLSNIAVGELVEVLTATKTAADTTYTAGGVKTFVISLVNSSAAALTGLTVTDTLGSYTFSGNTLYPLTYVTGSLLYYVNGALQATPTVTATAPLTVTGVTVPAGGSAMLIYTARVNEYAPLGVEDSITNTATITGGGLTSSVTATETINASPAPQLAISKSISPTMVAENGTLTYTLTLQNRGSVMLTGVKDVVAFDENQVVLDTELGLLTIKGKNLHMNRLTLEKGEADLEGQIDSLAYSSNESLHKSGESLFNRLFR